MFAKKNVKKLILLSFFLISVFNIRAQDTIPDGVPECLGLDKYGIMDIAIENEWVFLGADVGIVPMFKNSYGMSFYREGETTDKNFVVDFVFNKEEVCILFRMYEDGDIMQKQKAKREYFEKNGFIFSDGMWHYGSFAVYFTFDKATSGDNILITTMVFAI